MGRSRIFAKGLEILELIAEAPEGMTIQELQKHIELHRSSIYRYLGVMVEKGYLNDERGLYTLGPKVLELAGLFLDRLDVRKVAHPYLVELAEELHVTVHLAQLAGSEILYIDKVETHHSLPLYSRVGRKAPVHCTALGKALLAFSPPERLQAILKGLELKPHTAKTITDRNKLLKELQTIRRKGYAVDRGEHEEGIACVAAPIFDFYGEPVAAVSITDLIRNILPNEKKFAQEVIRIATEISNALGKSCEGEQKEGE